MSPLPLPLPTLPLTPPTRPFIIGSRDRGEELSLVPTPLMLATPLTLTTPLLLPPAAATEEDEETAPAYEAPPVTLDPPARRKQKWSIFGI